MSQPEEPQVGTCVEFYHCPPSRGWGKYYHGVLTAYDPETRKGSVTMAAEVWTAQNVPMSKDPKRPEPGTFRIRSEKRIINDVNDP